MELVRRTCNRATRMALEGKIHNILTGVLMIAALAGCKNEEFQENKGNDEITVQLSLKLPYAGTRGPGASEESEVKELDVLMFEPGGTGTGTGMYFDRISCTQPFGNEGGNSHKLTFEVRLRQGKYDLWIIANAKDEIDAALAGKQLAGKNESQVSELLNMSLPTGNKWIADANDGNYRPIPMWGKVERITIDENTNLKGDKNAVHVYRMLARADVTVSAANFELESVYVYNYITRGQTAPVPLNWDDDNKTTKPSEPLNARAKGPLKYDGVTIAGNACTGEVYLFEASQVDPSSGKAKERMERTCVVVGGKWDEHANGFNDDATTYYRMDFSTGTGSTEQFMDVLRNHQYTFDITTVDCKGYDTVDDAFEGVSRLIAKVTKWDAVEQNTVAEEQYYLKVVGEDELRFDAQKGRKEIIIVETNHPDGIEAILQTTSDWIVVTETETKPKEVLSLEIEMKQTNIGTDRDATIDVKAGNITKKIKITQASQYYPEPHKGWAGSNIYWDGSKLTFDDVGGTTGQKY
ncbi:MAG: FimB/Mfa2 family fimbrial subunit [Bacteroides intestinalis]|nr:FimB/Mfa2 family fimbrial subunit [Bacteroides intestinalis]